MVNVTAGGWTSEVGMMTCCAVRGGCQEVGRVERRSALKRAAICERTGRSGPSRRNIGTERAVSTGLLYDSTR